MFATDFSEMESASWQFIWSWFIHRWYHDINPTEVRKIYVRRFGRCSRVLPTRQQED